MTRIDTCFAQLKANNKKALIPYIMAGDPKPEVTVSLMHTLVEKGADVIELGLPFSDPMADGPTVSLAGERALAGGTRTSNVLEMVAEFRKTNSTTPIVLMGYLNPIEFMGYDVFAKRAQQAGVDGVLMVDLPPEEAEDFSKLLQSHDMNAIFLISPTTTNDRIDSVITSGSGYLYYVSLKGVTGSGALDTDEVNRRIQTIKAKTDIPVCVGFGIKDGVSAKACAEVSDGVVVGSVLVQNFADGNDVDKAVTAVSDKMRELREAIDG